MKKILLGSTAALGFAFAATQAQAEVDLSFGAEVDVLFGVVSQDDDGDNERDYGFVNSADFDLNLDGQADNGLLYGASMTVEADDEKAKFDESFLYVGGGWGELRLGNHGGAADDIHLGVPAAGSGGADGDYDSFAKLGAPGSPGTGFEGDGNKISYHGQFEDIGFGISFTPTTDNDASGSGAGLGDTGIGEDVISVGAVYGGDFDGTSFAVSAGVNYGLSEGDDNERLTEAGLAAELGFAGFTVGGFYVNSFESGYDQNETGTSDNWKAGLGVTYAMGALNVGVNGIYEEGNNGSGDNESLAIGLGADYALAPGLTTYGDITYFDVDDENDNENDGVVFLVGTTVNF